MRAVRIIVTIIGGLLTAVGFSALLGGGILVVAHATQRDGAGYYQTSAQRLETPTAALVARVDLGSTGDWPETPFGTMHVQASSRDASALFVGLAPAADVDTWLAGARYERVTSPGFGPFDPVTQVVKGDGSVGVPTVERFWVVSSAGVGEQTVNWPSERGEWAVVVMNANARPGVDAEVSVGAQTGLLLPAGIMVGGFGLLLLGGGVALMLIAVRRPTPTPAAASTGRSDTYPVRLDAALQPGLSRWLWLVKSILAIPHFVVVSLLWLAVVPLTVIAGFAILFTGRYPRSLFDFNVGVMRWSWRVSYYTFGALGTDRYPPFSLDHDPSFPADLSIEYPQRLSRGLVLVKWWLLALPHYIVVTLFAGGWSGSVGWVDDDWRFTIGGGLIGILVLVSAVVLAVTGRYPQAVFDFVMGMNRWCYRVLAYAGLMRDEYPPFRLDNGGPDPGSAHNPPEPLPAGGGGELASAGTRTR